MASSNSQIDKSQRGRPKRAELPDVNINTGAQSINTERASKTRLVLLSPYILNKVLNKVVVVFFRLFWESYKVRVAEWRL